MKLFTVIIGWVFGWTASHLFITHPERNSLELSLLFSLCFLMFVKLLINDIKDLKRR